MGVIDNQLRPFLKPLMGFGDHCVMPKGVITLPFTLGAKPQITTTMVEFVVIDIPSPYNTLLGCPSQNALRDNKGVIHQDRPNSLIILESNKTRQIFSLGLEGHQRLIFSIYFDKSPTIPHHTHKFSQNRVNF